MLNYAFRMVRRKSNLGLNQSRTKTQRKQGPQQRHRQVHNFNLQQDQRQYTSESFSSTASQNITRQPSKKKRQLEEVTIEIKRQRTHLSENTHSDETREDQANTESESQGEYSNILAEITDLLPNVLNILKENHRQDLTILNFSGKSIIARFL